MSTRSKAIAALAALAAILTLSTTAYAQQKHYRFAYDQPQSTGYGIVGDIFAAKLKELSKDTMIIDQSATLELVAPIRYVQW